jgi:tetratricopeptide (TPR) repeat protein
MRHTAIFAAALGALLAFAAPARAGMLEDCDQSRDLDLMIKGCTAVIGSGEWSGKNLAAAYYNRGNAYRGLGEYSQAIENYDQALRLVPGYAKAYGNRAIARCHLGLVEASLDDRMQALRLGAFTAISAQSILRDRGFYKGAIDGAFGPVSRRALRRWTVAGCP